ncbi:hypothetical protein LCGC14_0648040 [marine sediment metagenome]|uniref:Uncharacterized protein n=1 Tax=marine sediment metagenome TaxID=412755 RepID=A0A0F9TIV7_9ZZZZ
MTTLPNVSAFVHSPLPPFMQIAGPIPIETQEREYALSQTDRGRIVVAVSDIQDLSWTLPGACWGIASTRGQPYWVGFVSEEERRFRSEKVRLPLLGPMEGLLDLIEVFSQTTAEGTTSAENAIRDVLAFAETQIASIQTGNISLTHASDLKPTGDTVARFLGSVIGRIAADYRIRTIKGTDGRVTFTVDVGNLTKPTSVILDADVIRAGNYTRRRATSSITVVGAGSQFESRPATVVGSTLAPNLGGVIQSELVDKQEVDAIAQKFIGPASVQRLTVFDERSSKGIIAGAQARFTDRLRSVDQIALTLDLQSSLVQALRIGDVFRLTVENWMNNIGVDTDVQVRSIRPREEADVVDMITWVKQV